MAIASSEKTSTDKTPAMKGVREAGSGLAELFLHGIKDIYYAEKKLTKALPKMIKAAKSQDLIDALTGHLKETEEHVEKVEEIFPDGALGIFRREMLKSFHGEGVHDRDREDRRRRDVERRVTHVRSGQ